MQPTQVKIGQWLEDGFNLYKSNFGILILASLIGGVLSTVTIGILTGPMMAGVVLIALALYDRKTPPPDIKELFQGFNYFLPTFLLWLILFVVCMVVSLILSFIPVIGSLAAMILFLVAMSIEIMATILIVEQGMDFWPALSAVFEKIKSNPWPLLGFLLLAGLIGNIGGVACGIGMVLTLPIAFGSLVAAYRDLFSAGSAAKTAAPPPPPGPGSGPAGSR
jgi:uncharacterized membrane protein